MTLSLDGPGTYGPRIVVPEFLPDAHLETLRSSADVTYDPDLYSDRQRLYGTIADARAMLIRNRTRVDEELLGAAPMLEVIGRLGVGLDNIDVEAASRARVVVLPAHGANAVSVAEYVLGAVLVLQRGIFSLTESMVAGEWPRQGHAFGHELKGKVLGLVGLGAIAREVSLRASGFGMEIVAYDPFVTAEDVVWSEVGRVELADLVAMSDVISVHVHRNPDTVGLIGPDAIRRMKPTAIVINTSRGGVVDEVAVAKALRDGELAGAALDVFDTEPLGAGPAANFAGLGNLILTPHIAGNTVESVDRVAAVTVKSVLAALAG